MSIEKSVVKYIYYEYKTDDMIRMYMKDRKVTQFIENICIV